MTTGSRRDAGASIRQRLLDHARRHGDDYQRVLTRYAIERFLFRLGQTEAAERYVLKGAVLFLTWPQHTFRPTGDLDLLGHGDPKLAAITDLFTGICSVEFADDGIAFDAATIQVEAMREAETYRGVRLRVVGELARARIPVQVDIGFGDHVFPAPRRQAFPGLIPGLPLPSILMYPPETVVAEKFEAMIRFGVGNSRLKDFHDIWVTTRTFRFDLPVLVEAILGTFGRRGTVAPAQMPVALTAAFARQALDGGLWSGFLRRNPPAQMPPPFAQVQEELRQFFGPVIASLARPEAARGRWDPDSATWHTVA